MRAIKLTLTTSAFTGMFVALLLASALLTAAIDTQVSGRTLPMITAQS